MLLSAVYVYLCFYSVYCKYGDDSSEKPFEEDSSKDSLENKTPSKDGTKIHSENWTLSSTIETSFCKHQESREREEANEYKNTLIDYPYAASIQRQGSHYASGALVDKRWVLSVAGEFYNVRESIKLFRVRLGSVDCKRGGTVFPIKAVQIHPSFVLGRPGFDLSLLRLAVAVMPTFVRSPIALSTEEGTVVSARFLTTYWPRIIVNGKVLPSSAKERVKFTNMRVSTQVHIPSVVCARTVAKLDNTSLCLKPIATYHSICMPDVGAPVVAKDGLWGITSGWISPKCPSQPGPTLFTRVSTAGVRMWIASQLLP